MVLPTGAMGNLTGGYMAKLMGVPIGKLCAGVNINGEIANAALRCLENLSIIA
jgi:threonine synthase